MLFFFSGILGPFEKEVEPSGTHFGSSGLADPWGCICTWVSSVKFESQPMAGKVGGRSGWAAGYRGMSGAVGLVW